MMVIVAVVVMAAVVVMMIIVPISYEAIVASYLYMTLLCPINKYDVYLFLAFMVLHGLT